MKISEIKELIQLVSDTDIQEMELQYEEVKLNLRKVGSGVQVVQYQPTAAQSASPISHAQVTPVSTPTQAPMATAPQAAQTAATGKPIKAPMVGTFFRAARPDAAPFAKVGDRVKTGQTLCIIEAMKLMNQIEAEFSGTVTDILVEDGQPVEYGQILFMIDSDK